MAKIVVTEFVSLDGVIEEPRWTFDFDRGKEGDQFKYEELFDAESLLLGRTTYQGFAAAWPNMGGDDFGQRMNNIHKYVVSSTLDGVPGHPGPGQAGLPGLDARPPPSSPLPTRVPSARASCSSTSPPSGPRQHTRRSVSCCAA